MTMQPYDPSKYLPDPENPTLCCPVCDLQCKDFSGFEFHIYKHHDEDDLIYHIKLLQEHNWKLEKLIRTLTGKQSYEIINKLN